MSDATGLLALRFSSEPAGSVTRLVERRQRFPLRLTTPLYPDPAIPEMAYVYVQNPTGGVFPGDDLTLDVTAGPGSRVHVTTTAATKVYRGEGAVARSELTFRVAAGGYVEHVPDVLIPHTGARYVERVRVECAPGGTFVGVQSVAPGRVAGGECFAYELLELETIVSLPGGKIVAVDRLSLEPGRRSPARRGLLGADPYLGSILVVTPGGDPAPTVTALDAAVCGFGAATDLPGGAGALARILAPTALSLRSALRAGWLVARAAVLGAAPPPARK